MHIESEEKNYLKYKRILLKLSGEALKGNNQNFDLQIINQIAKQIIELNKEKYEIAIVIGGGNIWRGALNQNFIINRVNSDYIGMLATLMNSIFLSEVLNKLKNNSTYIFSKLEMFNLTQPFNYVKINETLSENKIVIFAAGTGSPFFTTDTTSILRALEINADVVLMAKNAVDGVYDSDPNINKNAKFMKKISYKEIIEKNLKIIDTTAAILANENHIKTIVFNINKKNSIFNVIKNKNFKYTFIE